jgi:predicted phage terminase large subunit-like protein
MLHTKDVVGSRVWASLYQQRPSAAEGVIFKREFWRYYKPTSDDPQTLIKDLGITRVLQAWDTAFKKDSDNDPSVGLTLGVGKNCYFLLDVCRVRVEYPELRRIAMNQYAKWKPYVVLIEDAASGQSLIQDLKRDTRMPIIPVKPDRDKVTRANAITPQLEAGLVSLPEGAPWLSDFEDECASFPMGVHDDQVDAFTINLGYVVGGGGGLGVWEFMREQVEAKMRAGRDREVA